MGWPEKTNSTIDYIEEIQDSEIDINEAVKKGRLFSVSFPAYFPRHYRRDVVGI